MPKLTLHPETLVVQSFPTTEAGWNPRGTVRGMDSGATCDQDTCGSCEHCTVDMDTCFTCEVSCGGSCASCPVSCFPEDCPSADGRC